MAANTNVKKKIGRQCGNPLLGKAIRDFRQSMQCDQKDFARLIGVSQAIISQWENGKYLPSAMALITIGGLPGADKAFWLREAGEDYALIEEAVDRYKETFTVEKDDNRVIQIHATAGAGPNRFPPQQAEARISLPRNWFGADQAIVGLRASDDLMAPLIRAGFLLLVDIHDNRDFAALENAIVAAREEIGVSPRRLKRIGKAYYLVAQDMGSSSALTEVKAGGQMIVGRVVKWIGEAR